jgi:DNA-binding transcriptional LysR family regulator
LDLTQIRYFLTLAKTLNFTRAAEQCNVTQPALTKSIRRLEEEFGGQLLLRERTHTQLTPLGTIMLPLLQHAYDAAQNARLSALKFKKNDAAILRVGLGCRVEPGVLAPLLEQLARRFPEIEIELMRGGPKTLNERLLASEIDVTITEAGERLTDRANKWIVFADPVVVLMPETHELARATSVDAERLRNYALAGQMMSRAADDGDATRLESRYPTIPPVRHRGETVEHIHTLVRAAHAVALSTARRALPAGIVRRPLEPARAVDVCVAAIAGRPMSRVADAFLRLARARDWNEMPN